MRGLNAEDIEFTATELILATNKLDMHREDRLELQRKIKHKLGIWYKALEGNQWFS